MTLAELTDTLTDMGEKKFRGKQIFEDYSTSKLYTKGSFSVQGRQSSVPGAFGSEYFIKFVQKETIFAESTASFSVRGRQHL